MVIGSLPTAGRGDEIKRNIPANMRLDHDVDLSPYLFLYLS